MGMEYGGEAGCSTELFVFSGKCFQEILDAGKHEGIDCCLIFPGKTPELLGEGKGDQIVLSRQPLAQLILDPLPIFMVLAMGTVSVATGMRNIDLFPAVVIRALRQHVRAIFLSALCHGLQSLCMAWQDGILVSVQKTILEFVNDRGEAESFDPSPCYIKGVGQRIDGLAGIISGIGSQMGVSGGCQDTDMAQDLL